MDIIKIEHAREPPVFKFFKNSNFKGVKQAFKKWEYFQFFPSESLVRAPFRLENDGAYYLL